MTNRPPTKDGLLAEYGAAIRSEIECVRLWLARTDGALTSVEARAEAGTIPGLPEGTFYDLRNRCRKAASEQQDVADEIVRILESLV